MAQKAPQATASGAPDKDELAAELTHVGKERDAAVDRAVSADEFLAYISHEMRTPMNGIIGITHLLLAGDLSDEQREQLDMIRSSSDTLLTLVNDLLDNAKIEANRLELETIRFDLRSTVHDLIAPLRVTADAKGIWLTTVIEPSVAEVVVGDPGRLRQVLGNLVSNAIKFTETGGVTVTIGELRRGDDGESVIGFAVADSGIGIPSDRIGTLFEPFTQAEPSTSRRFGGSGLGLSIAKRLVEAMRGQIIVESVLGRGSVFRFSTPLAVAEPEETPLIPVEMNDQPRVLVVTDHTANDAAILAGATDPTFAIDVVDDPHLAVERLKSAHVGGSSYAVAVIDLAQDAIEHSTALVQRSAVPALQVIVITPTGQRGDAAACRSAGIAGYLTGSLSSSELLGAIDGTLSGTRDLVTRHWLRERTPPPLKVLVVDDSAINRVVAQRILESAGHYVLTASSGDDAIEFVAREWFDAILMDVEMPGTDGLSATTAIRGSGGSYAAIPIAGLTSHAGASIKEMAAAAGMDCVIVKPFDAAHMVTTVEAMART